MRRMRFAAALVAVALAGCGGAPMRLMRKPPWWAATSGVLDAEGDRAVLGLTFNNVTAPAAGKAIGWSEVCRLDESQQAMR